MAETCWDYRHSRPATAAECDEDTRKRIAALMEHRRTMSPEKYADRMAELETGEFVGYRRCTLEPGDPS